MNERQEHMNIYVCIRPCTQIHIQIHTHSLTDSRFSPVADSLEDSDINERQEHNKRAVNAYSTSAVNGFAPITTSTLYGPASTTNTFFTRSSASNQDEGSNLTSTSTLNGLASTNTLFMRSSASHHDHDEEFDFTAALRSKHGSSYTYTGQGAIGQSTPPPSTGSPLASSIVTSVREPVWDFLGHDSDHISRDDLRKSYDMSGGSLRTSYDMSGSNHLDLRRSSHEMPANHTRLSFDDDDIDMDMPFVQKKSGSSALPSRKVAWSFCDSDSDIFDGLNLDKDIHSPYARGRERANPGGTNVGPGFSSSVNSVPGIGPGVHLSGRTGAPPGVNLSGRTGGFTWRSTGARHGGAGGVMMEIGTLLDELQDA
jgi:hypothetical protein